MKLVYIRHGQSEANVAKVAAGSRADSPLTEIGRQQARDVANKLKTLGLHFDAIVSSPLSRATETAAIVADSLQLNTEIIKIDSLKERDLGVYTNTPLEQLHAVLDQRLPDPSLESKESFYARVRDGVNEIKNLKHTCILIVGHAGVSRPFRAVVEDKDISAIDAYEHIENAAILTYDV